LPRVLSTHLPATSLALSPFFLKEAEQAIHVRRNGPIWQRNATPATGPVRIHLHTSRTIQESIEEFEHILLIATTPEDLTRTGTLPRKRWLHATPPQSEPTL
jgi:hypothetical protein